MAGFGVVGLILSAGALIAFGQVPWIAIIQSLFLLLLSWSMFRDLRQSRRDSS